MNKILAAFKPPFSLSQLARKTRSSANMSGECRKGIIKVFHSVTLFEVLTTCFAGKGKSKAEPLSVDEMSERMSRRRLTPRKGKAPASSSEPIALDNEPSATPSPVAGSPHQLPSHWIDLIIINLKFKITNNINDLIKS